MRGPAKVMALWVAAMAMVGCGFLGGDGKVVSAASRKEVGQVAFLDNLGIQHTLSEFKGKVVVVDVWATWCPPCRKGLPEVAALQKRGGKEFLVVPISVDRKGWEDVRPFLAERPELGLQAYLPARPDALDAFGPIPGIPTTIIVDREGRMRERWSGYLPGRAEKALEEALKEP